ncbi:MAG: hypothetical protein K9N47_20445 [Prosthecobacter sp.]|nr:hypothetical protein [Prosthecobacter sp.]
MLSPEQFEELLPLAADWAEQQEAHILASGVCLSPAQVSDAQRVGVAHPEQVRLLAVASIPTPEHPVLRAAGEATALISPFTAGLALRYGIFVRSDFVGDRFLVAHELVHTAQYERCGSFGAFLRQYLHECLTIGYPDAPMEQEAILTSEALRHAEL